jgi:hypothetical protein
LTNKLGVVAHVCNPTYTYMESIGRRITVQGWPKAKINHKTLFENELKQKKKGGD